MRTFKPSSFAVTILLLASLGAGLAFAGGGPQVTKVREQKLPIPKGTGPFIDRPYFDAAGHLRWNGGPAPLSGGDLCEPGGVARQRITLLLAPRVDEIRCARGAATETLLLGLDAAGGIVWRRPLGFRSGTYTFEEIVIGAAREGITLNNLTVLSPATGEILSHPPTHPVGAERRPVPDYELSQTALWLADRRAFVVFEADVTLVRRSGGLSLLDPKTGNRDLLLPVATTLLGGHWKVEAMAVDRSGRYLLLGQRLAVRGPGGTSFAVFDLAERRVVYEERFAEDHYTQDPSLVVTDRGDVGFSFVDGTAGQRLLAHYRLGPIQR